MKAIPPEPSFPRALSSTRSLAEAGLLGGGQAIFALHAAEMRGDPHPRRTDFKPGLTRDGATSRYALAGWCLVRIHRGVHRANGELTGSSVGHSSEKRANTWVASVPSEGDPACWDWKAVNRVAGKLVRHIGKISTKRDGWLLLPRAGAALDAGEISLRPYG